MPTKPASPWAFAGPEAEQCKEQSCHEKLPRKNLLKLRLQRYGDSRRRFGRENAGFVSGWQHRALKHQHCTELPGCSRNSPVPAEPGRSRGILGTAALLGSPWDLASPSSNVIVSPCTRNGGVPESVSSPCPLFQAQDGSAAQPMGAAAAECHCSFSSWKCSQCAVPAGIPAVPALGLLPCHCWGWRRSLLGILQEAKATGGSPSSCFKNIPSPAGKWRHLSVGPKMKLPSGALIIWNKCNFPLQGWGQGLGRTWQVLCSVWDPAVAQHSQA